MTLPSDHARIHFLNRRHDVVDIALGEFRFEGNTLEAIEDGDRFRTASVPVASGIAALVLEGRSSGLHGGLLRNARPSAARL